MLRACIKPGNSCGVRFQPDKEPSHDISDSLDFVRNQIRTAQVDGLKGLKNPAGLFVKTLKQLKEKRQQKEQLVKIDEMKTKLMEKMKF